MGAPAGRGRRRAAGVLALVAVLAIFVGWRWLIANSTGHLLFHLDRAEYALLREISRAADTPTTDLLFDPVRRGQFANGCMLVGDTGSHGTLAVAGVIGHAALRHTDRPVGTPMLRALGLGVAVVTLLAWWLALAGRGAGFDVALRFGALFVLAPAVWMKLNLIFWGTHEMVAMIGAVGFALAAGWVVRPPTPKQGLARAAVVGAVGALFMVLNTSAVIAPVLFGAWTAGAAASPLMRQGDRGRAAGVLLATSAVGGVAFLLGWWCLSGTEFLSSMGYSRLPWQLDKVDQLRSGLAGPTRWWVALRTSVPLWPGLAAATALLALGASGRLRKGTDAQRRLALFVAVWALAGWVLVALMPFAYGAPGRGTPFSLRYAVPFLPAGFASVAFLSWYLPPRVGWAAVVALGLACAPAHLEMTDWSTRSAMARYDGTLAYFATGETHEPGPDRAHTRFGTVSDQFARGLALMGRYQRNYYWDWLSPAEALQADHAEALGAHLDVLGQRDLLPEPGSVEEADLFRGVGYAFSLVVPSEQRDLLEPALQRAGPNRSFVLEGYSMEPPGPAEGD